MIAQLHFTKIRDVKAPQRGTDLSAGIDFFVPNSFETRKLFPGDDILIPSGVKVRVPMGYALIFFNKSGRAVKDRLQVGACVVDEDYQGEVHLHVYNTGREPVMIHPGDKLTQGLLIPVGLGNVIEVFPGEDLFNGQKTDRGEGGFGSTGTR